MISFDILKTVALCIWADQLAYHLRQPFSLRLALYQPFSSGFSSADSWLTDLSTTLKTIPMYPEYNHPPAIPIHHQPPIFSLIGAVILIPVSNLNRLISNPLQTHHVRTVLIVFLISLPFSCHRASSSIYPWVNLTLMSPFGNLKRNFSRSRDEMIPKAPRRWDGY